MSKELAINKERESGIELLKILSMIGIVVFHCLMSIDSVYFLSKNIDITKASTSPTIVVAQIIYYIGEIGNLTFFIASAWFLIKSKSLKKNKISYMIADVFIISTLLLIIFTAIGKVTPSKKDVIKSIFPLTLMSNWYITAYLLLYTIHPLLNLALNGLTQKQHLAYNIIFFLLYCCISLIKTSAFFASRIIGFMIIYFFVAYLKKYTIKLMNSKKWNIIFLITALILLVILQLVTNFLGLHFGFLKDKMQHWNSMYNPLLIIISCAMFNIFRNFKFKNKVINYISSITLLIYIIHENIIFRTYLRQKLIYIFWEKTENINILILVIIFGIILFVISTCTAILYNKFLQPLVHKSADRILKIILKTYERIENYILKIS